MSGYPNQSPQNQMGGRPQKGQMGGYPPQGQMGGYPPQGQMGGYPPQGQMGGYPPQGQMGGYPPQGQMGGYPPQGQMGGYPPQGQMGGYPPQGQMGGYAPQGPMGQPGHVGPVPPGQMGYPPRGPMGCIPPGSMGGYPHHGQPSTQIALMNPYYLGRPTVQPSTDFNASDDSQALYKAMKGLGTNESAIIKILSKRTFEQRKEIAQSFKSSFGKDLDKSLMSEISGKFERVVLLSLKGLPGLLASSMSAAIKGAGTNETILLQCIIPFQNAIIKETAQVYDRTTGHKLEADIRNDTSGDFQKILIAMIQGTRDESTNVDLNMVNADAQRLYKAGEGKVGTEEAVFTQIFAQRSFAHIKALSQVYEQQFKTPLVKAIKKETSSDYEDALVAIVKFAEDKTALLAEWLYTSMRGAGTDDESLILLVLSRSEIDLADVKDVYQRNYNKTLAKAISGDTSGDYKKMLLGLIGE